MFRLIQSFGEEGCSRSCDTELWGRGMFEEMCNTESCVCVTHALLLCLYVAPFFPDSLKTFCK